MDEYGVYVREYSVKRLLFLPSLGFRFPALAKAGQYIGIDGRTSKWIQGSQIDPQTPQLLWRLVEPLKCTPHVQSNLVKLNNIPGFPRFPLNFPHGVYLAYNITPVSNICTRWRRRACLTMTLLLMWRPHL